MLPNETIKKAIKKLYEIKEKDFIEHEAKAKKMGKTLDTYLSDEGIIDEKELYTALAQDLGVPFIEIKGLEINKDVLNIVPAPLAQTQGLVAFKKDKKEISIAMLDPDDVQTIEFIRRKTGLKPIVYLTTPSDIKETIRRYHADIESNIGITQLAEGEDSEEGDLKKAAEELPIVNIVNSVLEHAVYERASDIHIEPVEKEVIVRYRVDGVLKGIMTLPKTVQSGIVARIKIMSNLKLDEHMIPQDGRFKIQIQDDRYAFRVSIIPVYDGEKIVMRLLPEGKKPLTLDELGFLDEPKRKIEFAIKRPHGMVLVTGPTGSGKTTTLYSFLGILNQPDVNISTIEDPIEYHFKGINQSQVNPRVGFDFALGLRAFLRQDPDIIMVGEIRDKETAEIAIHAAMTGHLVLSTLHTNDAPTTLPRLMDMGIPPFLVAFTTNIIVAQRLVRKICTKCSKTFYLEKRAISELERVFNIEKITELFKKNNIPLKEDEKTLETIAFHRGEGCRACGNTGYKGRKGIFEVLEIDKDMIEMINERSTAEAIRKLAIEKGMITLMEDGIIKAKTGMTTIEEVLRVTRE